MAKMEPAPADTSYWGELPDEKTASEMWNHEWERHVWRTCLDRARTEFEPQTVALFERAVQCSDGAEQVAAEMGVTTKAVYNAKHRVLKRLRELRDELEGIL